MEKKMFLLIFVFVSFFLFFHLFLKNHAHSNDSSESQTKKVAENPKIAELISQLKNNNEKIRKKAFNDLIKKGASAVPLLMQALRENPFDDTLQDRIFLIFPKLGNSGINVIIEYLKKEEFRTNAEKALGLFDKSAVPILVKALKEKNENVRISIVRVLGKIKSKQAVPLLIKCLKDESPYVKQFSAESLGKIGATSAIKPLQKLFSDLDEKMLDIKVTVAISLVLLKSPDRKDKINFLINVVKGKYNDKKTPNLPGMPKQSKSYNKIFNRLAILGLGEIRGEEAKNVLIKALQHKNDDLEFVIKALSNFNEEDVTKALAKVLFNKESSQNIRCEIIWAFEKINDKSLLPYLKKVVKEDKDELVRELAKELITKLESKQQK